MDSDQMASVEQRLDGYLLRQPYMIPERIGFKDYAALCHAERGPHHSIGNMYTTIRNAFAKTPVEHFGQNTPALKEMGHIGQLSELMVSICFKIDLQKKVREKTLTFLKF